MLRSERARRAIAVGGIVQGVGLRPFVHGLAARLGLGGFVRNRGPRVDIEVEGAAGAIDSFLEELRHRPPPLARVQELTWEERAPAGELVFRIEASQASPGPAMVSADVSPCEDCLRELGDPVDRRHRYAFINCASCGPRLTVVTGSPYDRERTTMAPFAMCASCRAEYDDPRSRRFHAEATCCPACGPVVRALDGAGRPVAADDVVRFAAAQLLQGRIGALKGIGGYHLACDARSEDVVGTLRRRKTREEKPFAIMVRDLEVAESLCRISSRERELLASPARPILLLDRRPDAAVARSVAPGNPLLGVMLPSSPLHHLLLAEVDAPLVMTSGNLSDEPIAHEDADALDRLSGVADFFIVHDRAIHTRCDDSITRVIEGCDALPLRRSRGYAPLPVTLPAGLGVPTLAVGGQLKAAFALGEGRQAFLSHHLCDLDQWLALQAFEACIPRYGELTRIVPQRVVHDLHPDYASTRWAAAQGLPRVAVQHHHAHFASCLAENGFVGPAIGVCFDGTGYGVDGTIWGGEFLVGGLREVTRAAHLLPVTMPGGEQAIREPWRMAIAHLRAAGEDPAGLGFDECALRMHGPLTSSMGRLFDAVSAIAGVRQSRVSYEGQAAIELEWAAGGVDVAAPYPVDLIEEEDRIVIDTRPLIAAAARDARSNVPGIARRFHFGVVEIIARVCARLRERTGIEVVALTGGVFMNAILLRESSSRLAARGFQVLRHRLVPPNDGGLALGQLAAAAARD